MTFLTSAMLAAGLAALAIGASAPASALPAGAGLTAIKAEPVVIQVQQRDRNRGPGNPNANRRPGGGNPGHRPDRHRGNNNARDAAIAAGVLGIVGGLIAAGAAQSQPAWPRHCYRLHDFDPRDGTYIDHRGRVRHCR
ncbi:MAG: hypothetical protein Q8M26_01335 [Pseudolabrys sp.]|nr:hypothetical protein [Pseudolabrys sp.]